MRARRALIYMPGDDRHKIEKALTLDVDSICMDLEDGVAINRKVEARTAIVKALHELDFGRSERLVRINPIDSGLEDQDLEAILPAKPDGIIVPKIEVAEQLTHLNRRIEAAELAHTWHVNSIRMIAIMESARAFMNIKEIAAYPRLEALVFGAEDLAADIEATRTREGWEVFQARSMLVLAAAAYGLQAIDMVSMDFKNLDTLRAEAAFGAQLGYSGKQVIHPAQVAPVQAAFTPDEAAITKARLLVAAFEEHQERGTGAFAMNGKLIDMPVVRAAKNVLERAHAGGML